MNKLKISLLISLLISVLVVFAANAFNSPSTCSGGWTDCNNTFGDNANRATANVNVNGVWKTYGFSVPAGASVDSVVVRSDFYATRTNGYINVRVSGDGGSTFGPVHTVGGNTAEQTFLIDVTNDLSWTPSVLSNSNFVVNVTCVKQGSGANPKCNLDWLPVNVSYTPFDFSVDVNPGASNVAQGRNVQSNVTVSLLSGSSQNVSLSVQGCPPSSTCGVVPSSGNPTYSSVLTVDTSSSTPVGVYTVNVTGTDGSLSRSDVFAVNVTDSQPSASASANPSSGVAPLFVNFTGAVTGGDAPLSYLWNFSDGSNVSGQQNPEHTFTSAGTYNVSFTVTDFDGDSSTDYVLITVNEAFDFSVSLSPSVASVNHSNNVTTDVNVTLLSGTSENVNLSVRGCPWSSTCSFVPSSGNPTYSSVLTVATTSSTLTGTYLINVTGTSAGLTRKAVFNLTVTGLCTRANPFVLIQPDTQSGTNGSLLIYTTNVTNNDSADCGFSQFNLSKAVPAGWTGVLTSFVTIWAGDLASVEFNLTSNSSATPGNYSFNISALNSKAPSFTGVDSAVYEVV